MPRFHRSLLASACVALAAVAAATTLAAAPAGASATSPACQAVTRQQVSNALAKKAGPPKSSTVDGIDTCTWRTKSGIKVTYAAHPQSEATRADLDRLAADERNLVIAGVGDKAIAQCTKGGATSMDCQRFGKLYVLHGDGYSVVTLTGLPKGYSVENELTAILQLGRNSQGQA